MSTILQLQLQSIDEIDISAIEIILHRSGDLSVERWRRPRVVDPLTILTVSGGAVSLVNGLLDLRDRWLARGESKRLTVENESGKKIELADVTHEELEKFIEAS
jgi:hypothetical protein